MSFFTANHISAGYDGVYVIEDVCFSLERGQVMGIIGANGSGKTTLIKAICGNVPHAGNSVLDGCTLEELSVRRLAGVCAYVPQRSGIAIDISALDVVLMGFNPHLGILAHPNSAMRAAAREALDKVGLSGKENMNYMHLSEGQKQLCILARTLVSGAKLLLLDEPESALDFRYRYRMLELLRGWARDEGKAAAVTLHDPSLALNYCDQLLLLSNRSVLGMIYPQTDALDKMERMLAQVYGAVSLQMCRTRNSREHIVMLKEDEM